MNNTWKENNSLRKIKEEAMTERQKELYKKIKEYMKRYPEVYKALAK